MHATTTMMMDLSLSLSAVCVFYFLLFFSFLLSVCAACCCWQSSLIAHHHRMRVCILFGYDKKIRFSVEKITTRWERERERERERRWTLDIKDLYRTDFEEQRVESLEMYKSLKIISFEKLEYKLQAPPRSWPPPRAAETRWKLITTHPVRGRRRWYS